MKDFVTIEGIWLRYVGGENDANARVVVEVEVGGEWFEVINEAHGSAFSHCITATGIGTVLATGDAYAEGPPTTGWRKG